MKKVVCVANFLLFGGLPHLSGIVHGSYPDASRHTGFGTLGFHGVIRKGTD